jgi:mRNA interferase YafQ
MLSSVYTPRFNRDLRRMEKRGKDLSKLRPIIATLLAEERLPPQQRDHKLKGEWSGSRECHVEHDWLLLYLVERPYLVLVRTGTHDDIFGH